ncbi:Hint domain-containing protein [Rhodovulum euryhalinum]|uniref:Ca2+-binding RTX toxin-like protein n=1 Tax=Rhodovulum euryhalinum TaxID=35805 RepID=A0A4R2KEU6_9RHOB|nr:Hint domain-containing protein [Rhodovulum euryhalinum]TCO68856.1 Ca2+-binding RTX toxin-like protein [Rhodovulum euryhalinum]
MATTSFDVIYLGLLPRIDTTQGNETAENAAGILGTYGSTTDPLFSDVSTLVSTRLSEDDDTTYDTDNDGGYDTFRIDGGADQQFDAVATYYATLTYADGTTAAITAVIFQDTSGRTYLAPEATLNADQAALTAKPIVSLTLNSVVFNTGDMGGFREFANFIEPVDGTAGADSMATGHIDADGDKITSGNDLIDGHEGDDTLSGGEGTDTVFGGAGNDVLYGSGGSGNVLYGGIGDDVLWNGSGNDSAYGEDGNDLLHADQGADYLDGGAGDDTFSVDTVWGPFGSDTIAGGETGETLGDLIDLGGMGGGVTVTYTGDEAGWIGDGASTLTFSEIERLALTDLADRLDASGATVGIDVDAGSGNDTITGGSGDDTILGGIDHDSLSGGLGNDSLDGGANNDSLFGDDGNDTLDGGIGSDTIYGGNDDDLIFGGGNTGNADSLYGGSGNDTIYGGDGAGYDRLYGEDGDDFLDGRLGNDTLIGGLGADTLIGGAGDDLLTGEDGNDLVLGGAGSDSLFGGAGTDTVSYADATGPMSINLDFGMAADSLFTEMDQLSGFEAVIGSDFDDTISGGAADETLLGGTGDDWLAGNAGADVLTGGDGDDTFAYAAGGGADTITDFNAGNTGTLSDGDVTNNDVIDLSAFYDNLQELYADQADDGVLNQSNTLDAKGRTVDYSDNDQFGTGSLTITGATADTNFYTVENTGVVCFAMGTRIATPSGDVPIEALRVGDPVITCDNGVQPIVWIGRRHLSAPDLDVAPNLRPVRLAAELVGGNAPLVVSPQHGVLLREGSEERLIRAIHLARLGGGQARIMLGRRKITYFHIMFEAHQIIFANGAPCESFYPGPEALRGVGPSGRAELLAFFLAIKGGDVQLGYGPTSRPFARRNTLPDHLRSLSVVPC